MVELGDRQRPLSDYAWMTLNGSQSSIVQPPVSTHNFELKRDFMQIVQQSVQFHDLPNEDPNSYIWGFLEVCDMLKMNGVSDDAIRLRLVLFLLKGRVKQWIQALPLPLLPYGSSMWKLSQLGNYLMVKLPNCDRRLFEALERFKDLLRRCLHHNLLKWMEVETFHQCINQNTRQLIDSGVGGLLASKTTETTKKLIEEIAMNNYQWSSGGKSVTKATKVLDVSEFIVLTTQVEALIK